MFINAPLDVNTIVILATSVVVITYQYVMLIKQALQ